MIPLRPVLLLTGLLTAPPVLAADGLPPLDIIELYGTRKASVAQIREALGIREGDPAPSSAAAVHEIVKRLQRVRHVSRAAIDIVCCNEGRSILFVGVEEWSAPRLTFRHRPSSDIRLPEEISAAYDRLMDAWMAAVLNGRLEDDFSHGHSLASDPECRRIQEQFVTMAATNLAVLRQALREAEDDSQRAAAAWIIGYAPDKTAVVADLEDAMRDPDSLVRNNATRALGAIAFFAQLHPELGIRVHYEKLVEMLDSLFWSDRNKSLFVLLELTSDRQPDVIEALRRRSIPALAGMARFKSQFAQPAFTLLGRVAGLPEEEIQAAWTEGGREQALARIQSSIEASR